MFHCPTLVFGIFLHVQSDDNCLPHAYRIPKRPAAALAGRRVPAAPLWSQAVSGLNAMACGRHRFSSGARSAPDRDRPGIERAFQTSRVRNRARGIRPKATNAVRPSFPLLRPKNVTLFMIFLYLKSHT